MEKQWNQCNQRQRQRQHPYRQKKRKAAQTQQNTRINNNNNDNNNGEVYGIFFCQWCEWFRVRKKRVCACECVEIECWADDWNENHWHVSLFQWYHVGMHDDALFCNLNCHFLLFFIVFVIFL